MLPLSFFLFLLANLLPSSDPVHGHYAHSTGCFVAAAAAAHAKPSSGLRSSRALALKNPAETAVIPKIPQGSINTGAATNANSPPPSFAAVVTGGRLDSTNNAATTGGSGTHTTDGPGAGSNSTQQQQTTAPAPAAAAAPPATPKQEARYMIHLVPVNSSWWRDPDNVTYYEVEYRASNTAFEDICDVRVGIPLGGVDPGQVMVNSSTAMAFDPQGTMSRHEDNGNGQYLVGMLTPPYMHQGVRVREAVDFGFVLKSATNPGIANTGPVTVLGARYCQEGQGQQQHQSGAPAEGNEPVFPIQAENTRQGSM